MEENNFRYIKDLPICLGGVGSMWGNKQYRQGNRVYSSNTVAMALTAQPLGNSAGYSYLYLVKVSNEKCMEHSN